MVVNEHFDNYFQQIPETGSSQALPVKQLKSLVWEMNTNVLMNKTKLDLVYYLWIDSHK